MEMPHRALNAPGAAFYLLGKQSRYAVTVTRKLVRVVSAPSLTLTMTWNTVPGETDATFTVNVLPATETPADGVVGAWAFVSNVGVVYTFGDRLAIRFAEL